MEKIVDAWMAAFDCEIGSERYEHYSWAVDVFRRS
jgi:hypothetical protein